MTAACKIHWISGKGGVGKSTFAYALAQEKASQGERCLLVEIGDRSFFSYALAQEITYKETRAEKNLYVAHWHWQNCLKEYILHFVKVESLANLFMNNSMMRNITAVAPGVAEISILGKLTSGIRNIGPTFTWDHIIFDAHSTGHTKAYLNAPMALHTAIGVGPLGEHARGIDKVLKDSTYLNYYLVTLPEDLPTQETLEFHAEMKKDFGLNFNIIMNQVLPNHFFNDQAMNPELDVYIKTKSAKQQRAAEKLAAVGISRQLHFLGRTKDFSDWVQDLRSLSR